MKYLPEKLPDFTSARILVVGDVMLDRYWSGSTERISPEAPVPIVHVQNMESRAGGAANVALNISGLGGKVSLVGAVGGDQEAEDLRQMMEAKGIDCHFHTIAHQRTITKLRILSRHQQLMRVDFEQPFQFAAAELFVDADALIQAHDVVLLSDYMKGTVLDSQFWIKKATAHARPIIVDPKGSDFSRYAGATLLTPNMHEFQTITGLSDTNGLHQQARSLKEQLNLKSLLVTRGEQGMTLIDEKNQAYDLPTQAREVFDVTGAGDTVISVLSTALAVNNTLPEAMSLANLAAGLVVARLGTSSVSLSELKLAHRKATHPHGDCILNIGDLLEVVRDAKERNNETIVITNGCFDILHEGHVRYLEQASKLGDRLIVAVNSDDSVKGLKGNNRPINSLRQRMAVLASLGCVDWVISFSEETPERLIRQIIPDVLVKGGDYKPQGIAGYECVTKNGGKVIVLDFVDGCSTTSMIEKIKTLP